MGFKPKRENNGNGNGNDFLYPDPAEDGTQDARVSMIVDLGIQDRDNFEERYDANKQEHIDALADRGAELVTPTYGDLKGVECISIPQSPKQGVAVFVDLVEETVDYGGKIGHKHYRYMLNRSFKNDVSPITFAAVKPATEGGVWTFHGGSVLTKLAKATKKLEILEDGDDNMNIELLLDQPFLIDIDVSHTKKGEKTYTNVKHNAISKLKSKTDPDDVEALLTPAMLIAFDDASAEDVKFIRKDVRRKIMQAHDFVGSQMEAAFVEAGFCKAGNVEDAPAEGELEQATKTEPKEAPKESVKETKEAPTEKEAEPDMADFDDDVPF